MRGKVCSPGATNLPPSPRLLQVRLCLGKGDFVRAHILSKKISPRAFVTKAGAEEPAIGIEGTAIEAPDASVPPLGELKLTYYRLMIRYYEHTADYLEACRCYRAIYESEPVHSDRAQWEPVLRRACWYLALSTSGVETNTLLHTTLADRRLGDLPLYRDLLQTFVGKEVVRWDQFAARYQAEVAAHPDIFSGPYGAQRHSDLRLRVTQHNILVVSQFYSRIRLARLAELLALPKDEAEKHLCDMVVAKALTAKIDRPVGEVRFAGRKTVDDLLNHWSGNIGKLLELTEKACAGIQKESMRYKISIGTHS